MSAQIVSAAIVAGLTLVILIRVLWFKFETDDVPCTYKLFAARDALIRLVVEGKIRRDDPYFDAIYQNVNILLRSSRLMSGPAGWPIAAYSGRVFARRPHAGARLKQPPAGGLPSALGPITDDLSAALKHLVDNHFGIFVQWDAGRREVLKIQKEQAIQFLNYLPDGRMVHQI